MHFLEDIQQSPEMALLANGSSFANGSNVESRLRERLKRRQPIHSVFLHRLSGKACTQTQLEFQSSAIQPPPIEELAPHSDSAYSMPKTSARDQRLNELVHKHIRFVERVLRNLGVTEDELDDAVQRTFIVVANRLDDIAVGAEKSFLFKSAKHMASHVRRSRLRTRGHEPISDELPCEQESPEQLISQKKAREMLDDILGKMPDDLRAVFTLYEFEQLRMPEIAEMLDIPLGTVASRLRRARENFTMRMKRVESANLHKHQWRLGS